MHIICISYNVQNTTAVFSYAVRLRSLSYSLIHTLSLSTCDFISLKHTLYVSTCVINSLSHILSLLLPIFLNHTVSSFTLTHSRIPYLPLPHSTCLFIHYFHKFFLPLLHSMLFNLVPLSLIRIFTLKRFFFHIPNVVYQSNLQ